MPQKNDDSNTLIGVLIALGALVFVILIGSMINCYKKSICCWHKSTVSIKTEPEHIPEPLSQEDISIRQERAKE